MLLFLKVTATTEIYTEGHTLSLHDALAISAEDVGQGMVDRSQLQRGVKQAEYVVAKPPVHGRCFHTEVNPGQFGDEIQHREPEQGRTHVPDRYIQVFNLTALQRQYQR